MVTLMPPFRSSCRLTALVTLLCLFGTANALALDLETVQEAIRLSGARWVAGDTAISRLSEAEKAQLSGLLPEPESVPTEAPTLFRALVAAPLPTRLDWRDMDGDNYVTPAKHQGNCGACWAFAAVGALESYVMLRTHQPGWQLDLAEQSMLSCDTTGGCGGGSGWTAATILRDSGVPEEACLPYTDSDTTPCSDRCADWQLQARTISGFERVLGYTGGLSQDEIVDTLKSTLASHGPLWTSMQVHDDFYNYTSGVYAYTSGAARGGHAVLLIGFDEAAEIFIVKNSWGTGWGESGSFRIAYSEVASVVEFGAITYAYGDPVELGPEAPTADAGPDQTAAEGQSITLDGSASSDPDGEISAHQWRQLSGPTVNLRNADTPAPSFTTPNLTSAGDAELIFELTVTDDDDLTASDSVTVTVTWTNDAPTARAGADRFVSEGTQVALNGAGSNDPEGETLGYQWEQISGPDVALSGAAMPQASFGAPNLAAAADAQLVFELTVSDPHGASDTDQVAVTVQWENDAPTAVAGADQEVSAGDSVNLDGTASSDPDDGIRGYTWTQAAGPEVSLSTTSAPRVSFVAPAHEGEAPLRLSFQLRVADAGGLEASDSVDFWVAPQSPPTGVEAPETTDTETPDDPGEGTTEDPTEDPADDPDPGDESPPADEAREDPEPAAASSGGGGSGGGCFLTFISQGTLGSDSSSGLLLKF
jgi:C1A family cysteine protease